MFFTKIKLRRIYRRSGHLIAIRLYKLFKGASYINFTMKVFEKIEKFCHHYQMHEQTFKRFKFTIRNNYDFNYEIFINVIYLNSRPIFYIIDKGTNFNAAIFFPFIKVKNT